MWIHTNIFIFNTKSQEEEEEERTTTKNRRNMLIILDDISTAKMVMHLHLKYFIVAD